MGFNLGTTQHVQEEKLIKGMESLVKENYYKVEENTIVYPSSEPASIYPLYIADGRGPVQPGRTYRKIIIEISNSKYVHVWFCFSNLNQPPRCAKEIIPLWHR